MRHISTLVVRSPRKSETAARIVDHLTVQAEMIDAAKGWPALVRIDLPTGPLKLRLFCGLVHKPGVGAKRARPADERRIQYPGSREPITLEPGSVPLIVGWCDEVDPPALVLFDARRREGQAKRDSLQVRLQTLEAASKTGWAVQLKDSGEVVVAMRPEMLPFYLSDVLEVFHSGEAVTLEDAESLEAAGALQVAVQSSLVVDLPHAAEAAERIRVQVERLLRNPRFRRDVVKAYGGRCAVCGMQLELVEAAHLWPAPNPGSPDTVDNGVCLCRNHHRAFDSGLIRIDPRSWAIWVDEVARERLIERGLAGGLGDFETSVRATLLLPDDTSLRPDPMWLERRYSEEF